MKVLSWLFSFSSRHFRDIYRYEKGKWGVRIFVLLFSLGLVAATFAAEYLFISIFKNPPPDIDDLGMHILSVVGSGILLAATAGAVLDFCGCYAYSGIRCSLFGAVLSAARRRELKAKKEKVSIDEVQVDEPEGIEKFKGFDLFLGIFEIVLIVGTVVGAIVFAFKFPF